MSQKASDASSPSVVSAPTDTVESTGNVVSIATELAQAMPEVQEHAVQQAAREQSAQEAAPTDKAGDVFDPARHVVGADGKGILTVRGTWAQRRGRKAGNSTPVTTANTVRNSTLGGPAAPASPQQMQVMQQQAQEAQARASGVAAAELLFALGQMIGGEEWAPMENKTIGLDERPLMHKAFGDYFVATGKTDIPPGMALTVCIIGYAAPRFAMPKTQTRFAKIKAAVVQWWTNRKLRKMGMEATVAPKEEKK